MSSSPGFQNTSPSFLPTSLAAQSQSLLEAQVFLRMPSSPAHVLSLYTLIYSQTPIVGYLLMLHKYFFTHIFNEIWTYILKCLTLLLLWEFCLLGISNSTCPKRNSFSSQASPQICCSSSFSEKGIILIHLLPKPETWAPFSSLPLSKCTTFQQAPSSAHSTSTAPV